MCELLFDEMLSAEHIDLYLNLLCSESIMNQHGHEIDYLDSPAQASFYSKVIERRSGLEIQSEAKWVHGCRQQDGNLDCGLFVCMWAYCHAVDSEDIWFKAKTCDIKTLRPKLAAIFLKHRGVEVEAKYEINLALL
ncbi:hypothetical protein ABFS83_08G076500 [Erythranthe nasuta]